MSKITNLTERQKSILFSIIEEYIKTAKPVGSESLSQKFKLSSASLRNEMFFLNKHGYLIKLHASSGRIPTDKALYLFIDDIFENFQRKVKYNRLENYFPKSLKDYSEDKIFYNISRILSVLSNHFVVSGIVEKQKFFKFGLKNLFIQPEFKISKNVNIISEIIDNIDDEINTIIKYCNELVNVFIGKEIPFNKRVKDFSLVATKHSYKKKNNIIVAILGPKRMDYKNNILLMNSINEFFKKYDK